MNQRILHDVAHATALGLLRAVNQVMPSAAWCAHYSLFYKIVKAAIHDYMHCEERMRKRLRGAIATKPNAESMQTGSSEKGSM